MADKMPPRKLRLRVECQDRTVTPAIFWNEVRVIGQTVQFVAFPEGGERPPLPPDHPDHFNDGNIVQFIAKLETAEDTKALYQAVMMVIQYRAEHFSVEEWAQANDVSLRPDNRSAEVAVTQAR